MNELYDVLAYYSKSKKVMGKELMNEMFNYFIYEKGLENYVQDIKFKKIDQSQTNHKSNNTIMAYSFIDKSVLVDIKKLRKFFYLLSKSEIKDILTEEELNFHVQLLTMNIILHELEHANQFKMANEDENTFEDQLFKKCLKSDLELDKYDKNQLLKIRHLYGYLDARNNFLSSFDLAAHYENGSPMERFANIHANTQILNFLTNDPNNDKLGMIWTNILLKNELSGYDFRDFEPAPTIRYLNNLYAEDLLSKDDLIKMRQEITKHNSTTKDNLKNGLTISQDKYDKVLTLTKSIKK